MLLKYEKNNTSLQPDELSNISLTQIIYSHNISSIIMKMDSATARQFLKKYWDKITYEDRSVLLSIHQLDKDEFGQDYV